MSQYLFPECSPIFSLGYPNPIFFKHPNSESTFLKSALIFCAVFLKVSKETNSIPGSLSCDQALLHICRHGLLRGMGFDLKICWVQKVPFFLFFFHLRWPGLSCMVCMSGTGSVFCFTAVLENVCWLLTKLHCLSEPRFKALLLRWTSGGIHRANYLVAESEEEIEKKTPKMLYRMVGTWWGNHSFKFWAVFMLQLSGYRDPSLLWESEGTASEPAKQTEPEYKWGHVDWPIPLWRGCISPLSIMDRHCERFRPVSTFKLEPPWVFQFQIIPGEWKKHIPVISASHSAGINTPQSNEAHEVVCGRFSKRTPPQRSRFRGWPIKCACGMLSSY